MKYEPVRKPFEFYISKQHQSEQPPKKYKILFTSLQRIQLENYVVFRKLFIRFFLHLIFRLLTDFKKEFLSIRVSWILSFLNKVVILILCCA